MEGRDEEDPVVEADWVDRERKRSFAAAGRRRFWSWKRVSALLIVGLVLVVILATVPVRSVSQSGIQWYGFQSSNQSYLIDSGQLTPNSVGCVGTSTCLRTNVWVTFNWSTQDERPMTFDFYGFVLEPPGGSDYSLLYASENLSFGGYSFYCGAPPRGCGDTFAISTNATPDQVWDFDWEMIYNYTATVPLI